MEKEGLTKRTFSDEQLEILRKGKISYISAISSLSAFGFSFLFFFILNRFYVSGFIMLTILYLSIITSILGIIFGRASKETKNGRYGLTLSAIALFVIVPISVIFTVMQFFWVI